MRKLFFIAIALAILIAPGMAGKIRPADLNYSQDFSAMTMDTDANITLDGGYLVDAKLGESLPTVFVGSEKWCNYLTDGSHDEAQIEAALATGRNVHLVGNIVINDSTTWAGTFRICGDGPGRTVLTLNGTASIILGTSGNKVFQSRLSDMEITRCLNGATKAGTIGVDYQYGALFWCIFSTLDNLYVWGSDTDLAIGISDGSGGAGGTVISRSTFGPDPTDDDSGDNVSVHVKYGIHPMFSNCYFTGYDSTGLLVSPQATNNIWVSNCYINSGGESPGEWGIRIENGQSILIQNTGVEGNSEANLYIGGGTSHKITDCFFGGGGAVGNCGQAALISTYYHDIDDVWFDGCDFFYTNGLDGSHSGDAVIDVIDDTGGSLESINFRDCTIWDTGYGAVNLTNAWWCTISGCEIENYATSYGNPEETGGINVIGNSAGVMVQNNRLDKTKYGIQFLDTSSNSMVSGNLIRGIAAGKDAIHITSSGSATITNSTNSWAVH